MTTLIEKIAEKARIKVIGLEINRLYQWEIELVDGNIFSQFNLDGSENRWNLLPFDEITRFTFVPQVAFLPQHNLKIDYEKGDRIITAFGRASLNIGPETIEFKSYVNCVVTDKFRFYVSSDGKVWVTPQDLELGV